ncbi:MAG: hypothetical protein Q7V57_01240 [Actinomycetota bacterium]|nr:hypothetical protein [Actinomycetota bacterium]
MAISFSRPDPSSPVAVSTANFTMGRRGFEPDEVREFLRMVAAELARLQEREKFLERELRLAQRQPAGANVALDEDVVTRMLGEEAARILSTSREAAAQIKGRAEEGASRLLREATDEAQRLREEAEIESARRRQDAAADAESELQMAKQQGREMVNEARAYRERVLGELARRRELARQQIEQLVHGRDRLLNAFERARVAAVDVMSELTPLTEPSEFVNLAPITGPVPLMVPAERLALELAAQAATVETVDVDDTVDEAADSVTVVDTEVEVDAAVDTADTADTADLVDDTSDDADDTPGAGHIAPVVALFAGELTVPARAQLPVPPSAPPADEPAAGIDASANTPDDGSADGPRASVDDLFARLRASRAGAVAERAMADPDHHGDAHSGHPSMAPEPVLELVRDTPTRGTRKRAAAAVEAAPDDDLALDPSPFARRDAELTPLIVLCARKLKRVLADEQNDVLNVLRRKDSVVALDALLPSAADHLQRFAGIIDDELHHAALAGAASVDDRSLVEHQRDIDRGHALQPAILSLDSAIVVTLRERLERAVLDAGGDNTQLAESVRAIYREWKTQRIDEHLDDVVRMAFGRGALAALAPGTPICWTIDPSGPECADAEDNTLGGVIGAGDSFPTDHTCAPAHEGCRCMLQRAPR